MPRPNETSIACVVARRDTDVGFRVANGAADVGVWVAPGQCRTQALHAGEEVWWRLEPGTHALCVLPSPIAAPSCPTCWRDPGAYAGGARASRYDRSFRNPHLHLRK